jgi:hypothetical protein
MSAIAGDRTKLQADTLDRASTACFTVGLATPLAGRTCRLGPWRENISPLTLAAGIRGWLGAALALHVVARRRPGGPG